MFTLERQKANRKLWVEALRSGKYKQAKGALVEGRSYCCLGVLARCQGVKRKDLVGYDALAFLPEVQASVGLRSHNGWIESAWTGLAKLNDDGKSFAEIADIIEAEPLGLFAEKG